MKKRLITSIFMIFSIASMHALESNEQTKPIAKTIGGIVISGGAILYGIIVGPAVALAGIVDDFDGQVIVGPLITTSSIPAFYYGYKLLKSGIKDLDELEMQGTSNPLKKITDFIQKKEKDIKNRLRHQHKNQ